MGRLMGTNKRIAIICYAVSLATFTVITIWGLFFLHPGDEMGFVILSFYFVMPIVSLLCGFALGIKDGFMKWLYPVIFGAIGMAIPGLIFQWFDIATITFSAFQALFGLGIGLLAAAAKNKDVSSQRRFVSLFCYAVTVLFFLGFIAVAIAFRSIAEMGYLLLNYYSILPVTSLILGFILYRYNACWKWLYPVVSGGASLLVSLYLFDHSFDLIPLYYSAVPAVIGLAFGALVVYLKRVKLKSKNP